VAVGALTGGHGGRFGDSVRAATPTTTPGPRQGHARTTPGPRQGHTTATPGPHQGHTTTTPGPRQDHARTTPGPRHGHTTATPGPHQGHTRATPGPRHGHARATPRPRQGHARTTPGPRQDHTTARAHHGQPERSGRGWGWREGRTGDGGRATPSAPTAPLPGPSGGRFQAASPTLTPPRPRIPAWWRKIPGPSSTWGWRYRERGSSGNFQDVATRNFGPRGGGWALRFRRAGPIWDWQPPSPTLLHYTRPPPPRRKFLPSPSLARA
jgi:hypothetical protein